MKRVKRNINVRKHKRRLKSGDTTIVRKHHRNLKKEKQLQSPIYIYDTDKEPTDVQRKCFGCGEPLVFSDLCIRNPQFSKEYLTALWLNEDVELYCCDCFETAEKIKDITGVCVAKGEKLTEFQIEYTNLYQDYKAGNIDESIFETMFSLYDEYYTKRVLETLDDIYYEKDADGNIYIEFPYELYYSIKSFKIYDDEDKVIEDSLRNLKEKIDWNEIKQGNIKFKIFPIEWFELIDKDSLIESLKANYDDEEIKDIIELDPINFVYNNFYQGELYDYITEETLLKFAKEHIEDLIGIEETEVSPSIVYRLN